MTRSRRSTPPPPPGSAIWPAPRRELATHSPRKAWAELGRRLVASGGDLRTRTIPKPAPIDPIARAIANSPAVERAIGRPDLAETPDSHAWIEIDRTAAVPAVRLHFRGVLIQGEPISRAIDAKGRVVRVACTTGASRMFSMDALRQALDAARDALRAAGFKLGAIAEVRRTHSGGVAVIGLRLSTSRSVAAILSQ